ncbi:hypothetical protein O3M35_007181 [Rhynocoris fuscipes]|uniref:Gem nuclear organelle associated protein 8 n=1 Tax=Rhynocoris fuscipes TaxID=488301 RepID=A0AAW1D8G1_9HEMI
MKVVSISKTVKKRHKSRKKIKKRKFNKSVTKRLITTSEQTQFFEMSGNCFWSNYFKAFEWRNGYINFWNSMRNEQVQQNYSPNIIVNTGHKSRKKTRKVTTQDCSNEVQECIRDFNCITLDSAGDSSSSMSQNVSSTSINEDNCSDFEVSEEMIKFMEINMRHRADLEKEKERLQQLRNQMDIKEEISERDNIEECKVPSEAANSKCRSEEMSNLYGKSAPMIHGMETAIQLTFNWNCDHHKPEYWPILPFKFKFPSK